MLTSQRVYQVFNKIQQGLEIEESLKEIVALTENIKTVKQVFETIDRVFLVIYKSYEPGLNAYLEIKEFMKVYIESVLKFKNQDIIKEFLNHFCKLFSIEPKKKMLKDVSLYFLTLFTLPIKKFPSYYNDETLEDIKESILNCLKGKIIGNQEKAIKFLKDIPLLQSEPEIVEKLEELLNNGTVVIRKEVLSLFDANDPSKINCLSDMIDDDNPEIRYFVYDRILKINDTSLISKKMKVKLLFIGLSEADLKARATVKNIIKKIMKEMGILEGALPKKDKKKKININSDKTESFEEKTIEEKIEEVLSPKKIGEDDDCDMKLSPSRFFDALEIFEFINHPKYSYTFDLIAEALIYIVDENSLLRFLRQIIVNLTNKRSKIDNMILQTQDEEIINNKSDDSKYEASFFNDLFFLQLAAKYAYHTADINKNATNERHKSVIIKEFIDDYMPHNGVIGEVINYFYTVEPNVLILQQIFLLLDICGNFTIDNGNRNLMNVLNKLVLDLSLNKQTVKKVASQYSQKQFELKNRIKKVLPGMEFKNLTKNENDELADETNKEEDKLTLSEQLDNCLLPPNRKIIVTLEDLLENALTVLHKIYGIGSIEFLRSLTSVMYELNDNLAPQAEELNPDGNANTSIRNNANISIYKSKQIEIIAKIKEKLEEIRELENLKQRKNKNRQEIEEKIENETKYILTLDKEVENLKDEEKNTSIRILKIAEFILKNLKMSVQRKLLINFRLGFYYYKYNITWLKQERIPRHSKKKFLLLRINIDKSL